MSEISPAFSVSVSSLLQSYLTTSVSAGAANAASIETGAAQSDSVLSINSAPAVTTNFSSAAFSILNGATSNASATAEALGSGKLTTEQQKIIQAIGEAPKTGLLIDQNSNGSEPSELASLRSLGWVTLQKKEPDPTSDNAPAGLYTLTAVGEAIYNRTGGGAVGSSTASTSLSNATLNGGTASTPDESTTTADAAAADAQLSASVQTAESLLSSVGVSV